MSTKISNKNMNNDYDYDYDDDNYKKTSKKIDIDDDDEEYSKEKKINLYNSYVEKIKNGPLSNKPPKMYKFTDVNYNDTIYVDEIVKRKLHDEEENWWKENYPDSWGPFERILSNEPLTEEKKEIIVNGNKIMIPCGSLIFLRKYFGNKNITLNERNTSTRVLSGKHASKNKKNNKNTGGSRELTDIEKLKKNEKELVENENKKKKEQIIIQKATESELRKRESIKQKDEEFYHSIKILDDIPPPPPPLNDTTDNDDDSIDEDYLSIIMKKLPSLKNDFKIQNEKISTIHTKSVSKKLLKKDETDLYYKLFAKSKDDMTQSLYRTSMCTYGNKCTRKATCKYAHQESEIIKRQCKFGKTCFSKECNFSHGEESNIKSPLSLPSQSIKQQICKNGPKCKFGTLCKFKHIDIKLTQRSEPEKRQRLLIPSNISKSISYAKIVCQKDDENKELTIDAKKIPGNWLKMFPPINFSPITSRKEIKEEICESWKTINKHEVRQSHIKKRFENNPIEQEQSNEIMLTKTKLCISVQKQLKCPHGVKCRFAHDVSELVNRKCKYGDNCENKGCRFDHNISELVNRKCSSIPVNRKCRYGDNCENKGCRFDHNISELVDQKYSIPVNRKCRYEDNCENKGCKFGHNISQVNQNMKIN